MRAVPAGAPRWSRRPVFSAPAPRITGSPVLPRERLRVDAAEPARARGGEHRAAARDPGDQRQVWARPSSQPVDARSSSRSVRVPSARAAVGERHRDRAPEQQPGGDRGRPAETTLEGLLEV